jgi:AcrR family transcriptional regulator
MRAKPHIATRVLGKPKKPQAARLVPRKLPRQQRAEVTVQAILTAAAHILVKQGYAALNTNAVAQRAGVSVGSLYQYFPGKEALIAELMRVHTLEINAIFEREFPLAMTEPLAVAVNRLVQANVQAHQRDPVLHKALFELEARLHPADLPQPEQSVVPLIEALLARHNKRLCVSDLKLAAFLVYELVESAVHAAIVDRAYAVDPEQLAQEITVAVLRYLTARESA